MHITPGRSGKFPGRCSIVSRSTRLLAVPGACLLVALVLVSLLLHFMRAAAAKEPNTPAYQIQVSPNVRVNFGDETGFYVHYLYSLAVDGAGDATALWSDNRSGQLELYSSNRPAGGHWGPSEKVSHAGSQASPGALAVDPAGNAYSLWSAGPQIYLSYRPVGGSWISETLASGHIDDICDLEVGPGGSLYAIWSQDSPSGLDIYFAFRPAGGSWTAPVMVNDVTTGTQIAPRIAVDPDGNAYAVWMDRRGGGADYRIYFSRRPAGGSWSANEAGIDFHGNQNSPDIAVDSTGRAFVVWSDGRHYSSAGYDVYFAYRSAAGSWSTAEMINDDVPGPNQEQVGPSIVVDAQGNATAAWSDARVQGYSQGYYATRPITGTWGTNLPLTGFQGGGPCLALGSDQTLYAVWNDGRLPGPFAEPFFSMKTPAGSWTANERVDDVTGGARQLTPAVVASDAGHVYVDWDDERNYSDYSDIYFAHRPYTDTWLSQEPVHPNKVSHWQGVPDIALDGQGTAYAIWQDNDYDGPNGYGASFSYRPDGGAWQPVERVSDNDGTTEQKDPAIAVDSAGNAHAVWVHKILGGTYEVHYSYRPAGGSWGAHERVDDDPAAAIHNREDPAIAMDELGNVYVVWTDYRGASAAGDIYFSMKPVGGSWSANTIVNDDNPAEHMFPPNQYRPALAVDAAGNAYAVWTDTRNYVYSDYNDIFFAYRPAGGAWGTNQNIYDGPTEVNADFAAIAVDPAQNVFAVWADQREVSANIYLAYKPKDGAWQPNVRISSQVENIAHWTPDVAAYAANKAVVVWEYSLSYMPDTDIYLSYVDVKTSPFQVFLPVTVR